MKKSRTENQIRKSGFHKCTELPPDMKLNKKQKLSLVISGIFVGFLNGFFGGGGGMLGVPALTLSGLSQKSAHATAIAVILPLSIISAVLYLIKTEMEWLTGGFVTIGVVAGGILGAILLNKINSKLLPLIFYGLMIVAGVRMVI